MYPDTIILGLNLYDICLFVGAFSALLFADRLGVRRGFSIGLQRLLVVSIVGSLLLGIFGAAFFQTVYDWIATGVFSLHAGMTFYGGLLCGAGAFLFFWFVVSKPFGVGEEAKQKFKEVADMAAFLIPLAHAFGRVGCFFAGCCYGKEASSWIGVPMFEGWNTSGEEVFVKRVPLQLFEATFLFVLACGIFFWYYRRNKSSARFPLLPIYLVTYGVWRFFIEYARADDRGALPIPFLTPSQLTAVALIAVGVGYILLWALKSRGGKKKEREE